MKKSKLCSLFNPFKAVIISLIWLKLDGYIEWSWGWVILIIFILLGIDFYKEVNSK